MSHIIGRGRTARETYPERRNGAGGGPEACSAPLTRTFYVDDGTATPVPLQNGSSSCPYSTISSALAEIPEAVPSDLVEQQTVYVVLIAPGVYTEDVTVPPRRNIQFSALDGTSLGGGEQSVVLDGTMFLTGARLATTLVPMNVELSGMFIPDIEMNADGGVGTPDGGFRMQDCTVGTLTDVGVTPWEGSTSSDNTILTLVDMPGTPWAAFSTIATTMTVSLISGIANIFSVLALTAPVESLLNVLAGSFVTTTFTAPPGHNVQMDVMTSLLVETAPSLAPTQLRNVVGLTSNAWKHLLPGSSPLPYVFTARDSAIRVTSAAPGGTVTLPPLGTVAIGTFLGPADAIVAQERVVRNDSGSSDPITVNGSGGDPIEGGPVVLAPGECAIFLPGPLALDWMVIARAP